MKRTNDYFDDEDDEVEEALVQVLDREEKKEKLLTHAVMPDRTFNEVHRATTEKLKRLKEAQEVKTVKYIWECQWRKKRKEIPSTSTLTRAMRNGSGR